MTFIFTECSWEAPPGYILVMTEQWELVCPICGAKGPKPKKRPNTKTVKERKCKNCYFYTLYKGHYEGYGPCKRHAPSIGEGGYPATNVKYPMPHQEDGCGDFKERVK